MDNYLFSRWPGGTPAETQSKQVKKPGKKRRVWRDVLVVVLALVVVCGLAVASFFGVQYAAEQYLAQQPNSTQGPSGTSPSSKPPLPTNSQGGETEDWDPAGLRRSQPDGSMVLELLSREGAETLTAAQVYKKVMPSIVVVEATNGTMGGSGSGVVISTNGYIITNYHILEGARATEIAIMRLSDRKIFYDVGLVAYDKELDLAILKAEGEDFIPAELGSSDELEVGDPVYAIGNPLGYLYGSMTEGIVSAAGDRVSQLSYPGRLIQTSASLNSGNSGGALVDAYGRVVGITYAKLTGIQNDTVIEGVGLAIPTSDAEPYLARMLRTGISARPSIGISCYAAEVEGMRGIYVAETTPDTPAARVLQTGDLILSANGVPALSVDDLTRVFAWMEPGDQVELSVLRRGEIVTVQLRLYDRLPETE